jgi:hypothetical protein
MQRKSTGSLFGSLLVVAACAEPTETLLDVDADNVERVAASGTECRGETFAPAALSAKLAVDPTAGIATITIENHTEAGHYPQAKLTPRKSGGDQRAQLVSEPVFVAAGGTAVVRFSLASLALDPTMPEQLVAEVTIRDVAGGVVERTFARAAIGPSLADTAARLGIPMTSKASTLAAIARGGRSADISSFKPTHDTIDEIATNPTQPLPWFN